MEHPYPSLSLDETFAQLQIASAVLSRSHDLPPPPPLILREPQHERPQPHRERLYEGLIEGEGKEIRPLAHFGGTSRGLVV